MLDIVGLLCLLLLYILVLVFGLLAARWFAEHRLDGVTGEEANLVADRKLGAVVGVFTTTATMVGGGFVNGTAESVASQGLVWTLAPFGICLGLIVGGLIYAPRMRRKRYLTMLDPFQQQMGDGVVLLLYVTSLTADILWSASILSALGTSLSVIINLNVNTAILLSTSVAVIYTMFGQIVSVAYTDILQLVLVFFGLVCSIPWIITSDPLASMISSNTSNTSYITSGSSQWVGTVDKSSILIYVDLLLAMTFGTIPWQSYFQRILSLKSPRQATYISVISGMCTLLMAVPAAVIGAVATVADWSMTDLGDSPMSLNQTEMVLPLVLHNFTPRPVAIIGLAALSAAVMSSIDSSILSSSSMFSHNIYRFVRPRASQYELLLVQRCGLVVIGGLASFLAILVSSVYFLFTMAADLVYVVLFPQLTAVLYVPNMNAYGAVPGFLTGLLLRLGAGDSYVGIPALLRYPFYTAESGQLFPHRTTAMISSFLVIVSISYVTNLLFSRRYVSATFDILNSFGENIHFRKEQPVVKLSVFQTISTTKDENMSLELNEIT